MSRRVLHSAQMLGSVADELCAMGIQVQTVEARPTVRGRLRGKKVNDKLGGIDRFTTAADAVEEFQKQKQQINPQS
jgi:SulP family sulfate permease